jgi:DNA-binding beta-propeller fold protein YncE
MKYKFTLFLLGAVIFFLMGPLCFAAVEWEILRTLKLDALPLDMAVSTDGRTIYVLADDGNIYIYLADGTLNDKIQVGKHIDQIKIGPGGNYFFATSRQNKTVQIISLKYIFDIQITGSPAKGPNDSPVVIAVFSDFQ